MSSYDHQPLSLFQQTMREKDEEFYMTFPAARLALEFDPHDPSWHPSYASSISLSGCGFQLCGVSSLEGLQEHVHHDHCHSLHSPAAPHPPGHQVEFHDAHLHHTAYPAPPLAAPLSAQHEPMANVVPPTLHIATVVTIDDPYQAQFHQQQLASPVMDSLPSPESPSDASSIHHNASPYHTPNHQVFYTPTPPAAAYNASAMPSPVHQDPSDPLSPPALVQAAYNYEINTISTASPESAPAQYFPEPLPSPQPESSIPPPPRRNSQHLTNRTQRRYSPQYTRSPRTSHKSGGSTTSVSGLGWSPPPTSAQAPVNAPSTSAPASTSTLIMTRRSVSALNQISPTTTSKRHPEKKPALACVFCRGRKIACGPPMKDGDGKTCNQCQRRSLRCEYPTESRRGMRKKPTTLNINPTGPKVIINRKR